MAITRSPLQERVIQALIKLSEQAPYSYKIRINSIVNELLDPNVYIPNTDYSGVVSLVLLMLNEMPKLLENNSGDFLLKEVCNDCAIEYNQLFELTTSKNSPSGSRKK